MPEFGQNIPALKTAAIAEANALIGAIRARYITVLPGQEMLYTAKEAEALRFLALDPAPADLADFPLLASEVGVTAPTAYEVAQIVAYLGASWRQVASGLDRLRLTAINEITAAQNRAEIDAALAVLKTGVGA